MKTRPLLLILVIQAMAFIGNAQCPVDIYGNTNIHPTTSGVYVSISAQSPWGWSMNPSTANMGYLGLSNCLYAVSAKYIYGTNILYSSDQNLKKNIRNLDKALPVIKKLRPVSFDYNHDYSKTENEKLRTSLQNDDKDHLGFIAQEIQKILPQSVKVNDADSTLCIRMIDFIPILVKGMQEQTVRIDSLKSVIDELKASKNMLKSATITGTDNTLNSTAILYQNNPNPFTEKTTINCFIPENSNDARLLIFDMQGTLVKTFEIPERNQTAITISGTELRPGMYIYSLVLDNKEIDSKRMILTN
jgi:hypothetical protein